MIRLSIEEYWERLERSDRFYAWADDADDYIERAEESKRLFYFSRLSDAHTQLYTAYWTATYLNVSFCGDDIQDETLPEDGIPEAA